jgi:hypothetical protein
LVTVLDRLDDQVDLGDAYAASVVRSPLFGQTPKGDVLGETSNTPMAEEVPGAVFRAQVALVRAAKAAIQNPGQGSLETLRAASAALAAASGQPGQS